MYELINRSLIIVKPGKPFVEWANSIDPEGHAFTQKEMEEDCASFLIQDYEADEEKEEILARHYQSRMDGAWTKLCGPTRGTTEPSGSGSG